MVVGRPTPKPTCVSPSPAPSDCVTRSWNETALALNPVVFKLARLLPTTSTAVACALSAESAVEKDVNIESPLFPCCWCWYLGSGVRLRGQKSVNGCEFLVHVHRLFEAAELGELRNELDTVLRLRR